MLQFPEGVQGRGRVVLPGEAQYYTLKAREKELTEQREQLEERREDLARQFEQKTGIDKEGVGERLKGIDQRLQKLEIDLGQVAAEVANAAPATLAVPEPIIRYRGNSDEDMVAAGFIGGFMTLALLSPFFFRAWRRRRRAGQTSTTTGSVPVIGGERIERMEQSIEAIAVEIERVSENQRFMTRLMTETQLAGTIAAVRGSTEAAKAAAERQSNV
jgi:archaellum component FlaC